jgi:hypothetical protein
MERVGGSLRAHLPRIIPLLALGLLMCCSCAGRSNLHPVRGQVFVAGKPAEGALVVFHPLGETTSTAVRPSARVGKDGRFALGTHRQGDGATVGNYAVAIAWTEAGARAHPLTGEVPVKLSPRYAQPRQSPFRVEVKPGNNDVPAFRIDR